MNKDKYLTVGALTRYIKYKLDSDEHLKTVFLKGEISNFKAHSTGHFYFSIKDETSKINAIMFSMNSKKIKFTPKEGSRVLVVGRISVYESTGNYQIYVDEMIEDGVGNLFLAFEALKDKLSKEGLFLEEHKKSIPRIPKRIGIVTAPTGAAIKDILSTIKKRFPICETILFPSLVQGENAASDIVRNIRLASNYDIDTLIVGRGGGSLEDLWPFNEEIVARAIYESGIPIISAVGHEVDFTIADFVADLRAPTPTGAAVMCTPDIMDLLNNINQVNIRLNENMSRRIKYQKLRIEKFSNSFVIKNPMIIYENKKQKIIMSSEKINNAFLKILDNNKNKFNTLKGNYILNNPNVLYNKQIEKLARLVEKMDLVNPMEILKKGYSLTKKDDKIIKKVSDLTVGDNISVSLSDGIVLATVNQLEEN